MLSEGIAFEPQLSCTSKPCEHSLHREQQVKDPAGGTHLIVLEEQKSHHMSGIDKHGEKAKRQLKEIMAHVEIHRPY